MTKIIPYNDYGGYIPKEHNVIGTVRQTFGNLPLRNGWKIIEVEDEEDNAKSWRQG